MGQESVLFTILSTLYIAPIFYIFEKRTQNFLSSISTLLFVDNGLFISLGKSYKKSNANIFSSYSIISSLFEQFSLMIEHNKLEVFYFSRSTKNYNSSPLDLGLLGGPLLQPKYKQRYLGFIFNRKLSFHQHIHFYSNKALSSIKDMKILDNSTRGLLPLYKHLLYRTYIMLIALYCQN